MTFAKYVIMMCAGSMLLTACSPQEPPFTLAKSTTQEQGEGFSESFVGRQRFITPRVAVVNRAVLTSKVNGLVVSKITVNRGNCTAYSGYAERTLDFG